MTPDDDSQLPIERLTAHLLQRVREDAALSLRSAANDDDMMSRITGWPAMRAEPEPPLPPLKLPGPATADELEALVALALQSANDAARDASAAGERARRCMLAGIAIGAVGLGIAATTSVATWLQAGVTPGLAEVAAQVDTMRQSQRQITAEVTALETRPGLQPASMAAPPSMPLSNLPPLPTVHVGVLPAVPAVPMLRPAATSTDGGRAGMNSRTQAGAERPVYASPAAYVSPAPAEDLPSVATTHHFGRVQSWPTSYARRLVYRRVWWDVPASP